MNNTEKLNESINSLGSLLELNENNIDPKLLEQLENALCNIEYNFSSVEDELRETKDKLIETENELNKRKEIIWNNNILRGQIIGSSFCEIND